MLMSCSRIGTVILAGTFSVAIFASARAASHSVLYSFTGGGDGTGPAASLTNLRGLLYGTTYSGGANGLGAVFRVSTAGAEKLVYSFRNGADGASPKSPVLNVGGILYGTTQYGGGSSACTGGCGTVFAVTPAGEKIMLYAFRGGADGANPTAGLIDVGGILYGTSRRGRRVRRPRDRGLDPRGDGRRRDLAPVVSRSGRLAARGRPTTLGNAAAASPPPAEARLRSWLLVLRHSDYCIERGGTTVKGVVVATPASTMNGGLATWQAPPLLDELMSND
jgi:uncharacterized repeat protein (TIGR03803 family)